MLVEPAKRALGTQVLAKSKGTLSCDGSEIAPSSFLLPHVLIKLVLVLLLRLELIDWHGDPILLILFIFVGV